MANIVIDPSASGLVHLGPLTALYGMRVDQWPWRVRMQLQLAVVLASSCLWRKLRRSLQCFPWLLVPLCDDNASEADQQAAAKRLFDCPLCCLDEGLGRRLRNSVDSWECLLQEPLRTFLKVFFQRAVVTSTFVERCFAALTRFSKPPQSCATLAAKHTNATFAQIVEQWRASQGVCAHEQTKSRPAWMQTHVRGFSLNGYQLFARDMKTTSRTMVFMMPTFYSQNNGGLFLQRRGAITVGAQRPSGVAPGVARALWTPCWVASTK